MQSNLKKGTVITINAFPEGTEFTIDGDIYSDLFGDYFPLSNGGIVRPHNISSVVREPEPVRIPVGTQVRWNGNSLRTFTIERIGDDLGYSNGELPHYFVDGGYAYPSEVTIVAAAPEPEPAEDRDALVRDLNLSVLKLAIHDGASVEFDYEGESDDYPNNRYIKPTELTDDGRVVGEDRDQESSPIKSFRLDRIEGNVQSY